MLDTRYDPRADEIKGLGQRALFVIFYDLMFTRVRYIFQTRKELYHFFGILQQEFPSSHV